MISSNRISKTKKGGEEENNVIPCLSKKKLPVIDF
jgi:hypothetical protein